MLFCPSYALLKNAPQAQSVPKFFREKAQSRADFKLAVAPVFPTDLFACNVGTGGQFSQASLCPGNGDSGLIRQLLQRFRLCPVLVEVADRAIMLEGAGKKHGGKKFFEAFLSLRAHCADKTRTAFSKRFYEGWKLI